MKGHRRRSIHPHHEYVMILQGIHPDWKFGSDRIANAGSYLFKYPELLVNFASEELHPDVVAQVRIEAKRRLPEKVKDLCHFHGVNMPDEPFYEQPDEAFSGIENWENEYFQGSGTMRLADRIERSQKWGMSPRQFILQALEAQAKQETTNLTK